ncbi:histidine kinase [Candidatus Leptofilum sp.]|uniref:GAF domain-containing sensor histidine kinase n=1 Tax=Candidatus Leptofilum sp. TaxID=3241576 RepID=UPI003B5A43D1
MSKNLAAKIKREFRRLNGFIVAIFLLLIIVLVATFFVVYSIIFGSTTLDWLPAMAIGGLTLLLGLVLAYAVIDRSSDRIQRTTSQLVDAELHDLRAANNRAKSLQSMASVMRATLSFERVVEEALDVCSLAIEEMGIPRQSLVGAVFLFNGEDLEPVATRRFTAVDFEKQLQGKRGIVGAALTQAEPVTTDHPRQDPELRQFIAFHQCLTAACIPLRAGFQIFGAIVIGSDTAVKFDNEHFELFNGVADQAVIALQNAQLYQRLEAEKQRIIEADEEARKELARDLHDGPTQTIAAIAMRINFIRSLLSRDPEQALGELEKVEELAKQTSKEIRGMLFTLRPLVLETQGLGAAVETVIARIKETDGLNIHLIGGDHGELLNEQAQSVVFSIVEEALGNARKYSRASKIQVRFWQEDNLFVALVQDNGVGFDVQAVNQDYSSRGSLGMVNMRERADRIDGSLRLESAPGHGTSVTLVVPLDKHGSHVTA